MRILVVNTVHFRLNGITAVIMNYYRGMDKTKMTMDFMTIGETNEGLKKELQESGACLYELKRKQHPLHYMMNLTRILRKNSYDVIHVHGNSTMMLVDLLPAKWAGVPVRIAHVHNTDCSNRLLHLLIGPAFRKSFNHGFACGEQAGKCLYGSRNFLVVRNGINLQKFNFLPEVRAEYRWKIGAEKRKVIGHVGHFTEQKNQGFLIDLLVELKKTNPEILLLLIGDGILIDEMKKKAEKNEVQDDVLFCGNVPDVQNYLMAMDLFILPSLYEGMPVSLIEAQVSGLPCIASDKISPEAGLTNLLSFLPLEEREKWKNAVLEKLNQKSFSSGEYDFVELEYRQGRSREAALKIAEQGYAIKDNADRLQSLYQAYIEEATYGKYT